MRKSIINRSNMFVNLTDRQELELALNSIQNSYVKAKKDLQIETHQVRQDLLYREIEVLGKMLEKLEKSKKTDLPVGG